MAATEKRKTSEAFAAAARENGKKGGRPRLAIDEQAISDYAGEGAPTYEIARMVGCSEGVLRARFSEQIFRARAFRRIRLREMQWKAAKAGSVPILIWLGKNLLGQSDKPQPDDASNSFREEFPETDGELEDQIPVGSLPPMPADVMEAPGLNIAAGRGGAVSGALKQPGKIRPGE